MSNCFEICHVTFGFNISMKFFFFFVNEKKNAIDFLFENPKKVWNFAEMD